MGSITQVRVVEELQRTPGLRCPVTHGFQHEPEVIHFLGIALDANSGSATAFICELLRKGRLVRLMSIAKSADGPISKDRREKWCRQHITGP
jgi:hypothetical protein